PGELLAKLHCSHHRSVVWRGRTKHSDADSVRSDHYKYRQSPRNSRAALQSWTETGECRELRLWSRRLTKDPSAFDGQRGLLPRQDGERYLLLWREYRDPRP